MSARASLRSSWLTTKRLVLRPLGVSDAEELLAVFRDPSVRRYLLDDLIVSPEWVREEIESSEERFAENGAGLWTIRLTGKPQIVGFVGFRRFFDPPQLQLLYGLLPEFWGQGIATESAAAICDYAFATLGFEEVRAATDLPNEASVRVLERLGMTLDRTTEDGLSGTAFYSLDRRGWDGKHPPSNV